MAQEAFPLHVLVWNNQYLELDRELQKKEVSLLGWRLSYRCAFLWRRSALTQLLFGFNRRCSRIWIDWIRGGAPLWSWLYVWATWSPPGCCSGTLQTRPIATHRVGPVSAF